MGRSANPINPLLDPAGLQSNGGPTDTIMLEPGSPAIDAGDSSVTVLSVADQRGFGRIVGDGVDVGAYEAGASAATTDLSVNGSASASVLPGGLITYTLTVTNNSATTQNNVTLIDGLPAHTTFVSWATPNDWASSAPSVGSAGTASAWINSLTAGASATFTLVIQLDSDTPPFVAVTNSPIVGPIIGDPNLSNNTVALNTRLDYFPTASSAYELMYDVGLAHLNGGSVSITLPANASFDFTAPNDSTNGANALAVITGSVTIIGNGSTIERTGGAAFRLFDMAAGGSLTLQDLTLQGGLAQGVGAAAQGGAIYSAGTLDLVNVAILNNKAQGVGAAAQGGAIYSAGTLDLVNVAILNNKAQGVVGSRADSQLDGRPGSGGGLYVAGGAATLTNDTLSGNLAQGGQGGVNSSSRFGGAGGVGAGGGLYVAAGSVTLNGDTLNGNQAIGGPAGSPPPFDGDAGTQASPGGAGMGGGLYAGGGTVTLTNVTLFGNSAQGGTAGNGALGKALGTAGTGGFGGTGGAGSGGGLEAAGGTIRLTNDTLSSNSARGGAAGNGGAAQQAPGGRGGTGGAGAGGGLAIVNGTSTTLVNTLIAKNTTTGGSGGVGGPGGTQPIHFPRGSNGSAGVASAPDVSGNVSSSDDDVIGDGSGSNLSNLTHGDQVGSSASPIDPKLGPLQNNGGPTQTMALLPGSPAIDAGDTAVLSTIAQQEGVAVSAATDQRGVARSNSAGVDVGAFEYQAPLFTTTNKLLEAIFGASNPYSQTITATATGGAAGPVTFALAAGATLPPGLMLVSNGTVSGTPTQLGQFSFTITASDSDGDVANQLFTLYVDYPTSISVSASSAGPVYGQTVTLTATVTTPAGDPTPTSSDGTVNFYDGATLLGSANLSGSTGIAALSTAVLAVGATRSPPATAATAASRPANRGSRRRAYKRSSRSPGC